jgi:hypothetical protein
MSEQYAFAIGFDDVESDEAEKLPEVHWIALYEQVAIAIQGAGLPPLDSERWDEFGQGRIFWGTKAECDAVKLVLDNFRLYIEEACNLETGYYATPNHTYFVSDAGTIYILPSDFATAQGQPLETTDAIPLDSYRFKVVDPDVDLQWKKLFNAALNEAADLSVPSMVETSAAKEDIFELHQQIATLSAELEPLKVEVVTKVEPEVYATLEKQYTQQTNRITELESQQIFLEAQVVELQTLVSTQIDPQIHADLQQQFSSQTSQIQDLQQRLKHLDQQFRETSVLSAQKVDPSRYNALEQDVKDKTTLINDLKRTVQQLERDLGEWQTVAEAKVEWSEYQALQDELKQYKMRRKKGLLGRLFS